MTDSTLPLPLVMAQAAPGQPSLWIQLFPFALMLLIFYVLVLLPMRRRQRKVQEFQAGLKVGDKVILTSGIHGQITRMAEGTVQLQIADRVRVEVSRAAVGGYQGQEPVVQSSGNL
ncbi:MAG TPA: preprotein translocase subunit YajC [Vicinamibacterales bacterium]|nr:preprotein translocase subunit YajC [Vicinamibacterales bacterium]